MRIHSSTNRKGFSAATIALVVVLSALLSCAGPSKRTQVAEVDAALPPQFLTIAAGLHTGGQPRGAENFHALAQHGVTTVISVDGARPQVDAAAAAGLSYVHVPIGYDGISDQQAASIIAGVTRAAGGVYVHCHHGHHRGPAAAAVAGRFTLGWDAERATHVLDQAGTSRHYHGLFEAMQQPLPTAAAVDAIETLPAIAPVAEMTAAMAVIDRRWDRIKLLQAADWTVPAAHPDMDPAHELLMLREAFRELARAEAKKTPPAPIDLIDGLRRSEHLAEQLETILRSEQRSDADKIYQLIRKDCKGCHRQYRD